MPQRRIFPPSYISILCGHQSMVILKSRIPIQIPPTPLDDHPFFSEAPELKGELLHGTSFCCFFC